MLTWLDHLVVLHVTCVGTQDDMVDNLPQDRGQTDRPVVTQILLLVLLDLNISPLTSFFLLV